MSNPTSPGPAPAPSGQPIHVSPPSHWPIVLAVGIALGLAGLVLSWVVVAVGLIIMVVSITAWIRDARKEFDALH